MMFESINFRAYLTLTNVNHYFPSLVFTGSSGLTFTVGELPGSLASIGKFLNDIFFSDQLSFSLFIKHKGFPLRNKI